MSEYSVNDNSVDDDDEIEVYDDDNNEDRLHLLHICYVVGTQFACITWSSQHSAVVEI